jgi:hypothetical protein
MATPKNQVDAIAKLEKILVEGLNRKLGTKFSTAEDMAHYLDARAEAEPRRKTA